MTRYKRMRTTRGGLASQLAMLLVWSAAGCGDLTRVNSPDVVLPSTLNNPAGAATRQAGALGEFATTYTSEVMASGTLADEYFSPGPGGVLPFDQRRLNVGGGIQFAFSQPSQTRVDLLLTAASLEQYAPQPAGRIGEAFALLGYIETMMVEDMCSGVPLATVVNGTPTPGPSLVRHDLIVHALAEFDSAAAHSTDSAPILNLTRVGRGRVLMDSGDYAAAAAAVAGVPAGFSYVTGFDGQNVLNYIHNYVSRQFVGMSDREGENGLNFASAGDARLPLTSYGQTPDGRFTIYGSATYPMDAAPMVLASGVEAQLIRAEAALSSGDITGWADTLNSLRQNAISPAMLPLPLDSTLTANQATRVNVMFRERAFWLFSLGHRLGDLRRLIRQYGRATESVYPTGPYEGGPGTYGTVVVFPVDHEESNPLFHGCANLDP